MPAAAVPVAQPVAAPVPLAAPVESESSSASLRFTSTPDLVAPRLHRQSQRVGNRRRLSRWLLGVAGVPVIVVMVWAGMWLKHFLKQHEDDEETARVEASAYNCQFSRPAKPWVRDKGLEQSLNANFTMTSPRHNSAFAILFRDYRNRLPSDAEMLAEATSRLRSFFRGLEWEPKSGGEPARLAGRPAQVIEFQGEDRDDVTINGECHLMAFRGYGYWFFTWAPLGELQTDGDAIRDEWTRLRQRLTLLDGRKGWTAKPPDAETVSGTNAKYVLKYVKGLWTREPVEGAEADIDLLLRGHEPDPERKPLAGKDATLQVLVLPKQANLKAATASARELVKQRELKLYERTTLETIKDKNGDVDRDADIGKEHGHLIKWHAKNTPELERFLLAAVVNRPEGVVVLLGDCLWERRDFWDQELMALLKTFKAR
jgi:hypothetical protein